MTKGQAISTAFCRDLMEEYINTRGYNLVAWITTVVMIVLTLILVLGSVAGAS